MDRNDQEAIGEDVDIGAMSHFKIEPISAHLKVA